MTTPDQPNLPESEQPAATPLSGEVLPPAPTPTDRSYDYRAAAYSYASGGRPGGITLLGILFILLGVFSIVWGVLVLAVGGLSWLFGAVASADQMAAFGSNSVLQAVLGIGGGLLQLVVAFGLLALKKWAWLLAFVAIAASVAQGIVGIFSGAGVFGICCGLIGLIIPVWIVVYLLRKDVRAAFGR